MSSNNSNISLFGYYIGVCVPYVLCTRKVQLQKLTGKMSYILCTFKVLKADSSLSKILSSPAQHIKEPTRYNFKL